jgi:hypothetical protein
MPVLSGVIVIFLGSIVVLTTNGQCLDCSTIVFSLRYRMYFPSSGLLNVDLIGDFTLRAKRPEYLAPVSSAVNKNTWVSTSSPSCCFTGNPLPLLALSYARGAICPLVRPSQRSQQIESREHQTLWNLMFRSFTWRPGIWIFGQPELF